jgi:hypothetical protein
MSGFDNATWQALGLVLTLLGLGASAFVWMRRGPVSGLRAVAWSLLPLAAGLTGTLRLAWDIIDSIGTWGARLVFSPVVWLGIVVAGVSLVLFVVTGVVRRRQGPRATKAVAGDGRKAVTSGKTPKAAKGQPQATPGLEGMEDIEAILRKHGIS